MTRGVGTGEVQPARKTGLSLTQIFGYGVGNFGASMLSMVIVVHLPIFYTDTVGLSAGYVGLALLLAKSFDAVTDPVMGYLSDRTNTRWGRRRPYILGAAIPLGIAFYFLFSPPVFEDPRTSQMLILVYMLSFYVLTYLIWTIATVPYYSLGAELTDDYNERVKVYAIREVCSLTGLAFATFLPGFLIFSYGHRVGYNRMALILGVTAAIFMIISGLSTKERAGFSGRKPMSPYRSWAATFQNPHFRKLLITYIFSSIASAIPAILIVYIATYIVGTPEWWSEAVPGWLPTWSFYLLIYFSAGVLALPFWNRLAQRIGKRNTWIAGISVSVAGSLGCSQLDTGTVWLYSSLLFVLGAAFGNYLALPSSMIADVIDWDEAQTGRRREGAYFAINAFVLKCSSAITGATAMALLGWVGYEAGQAQSEEVRSVMIGLYSWFPATFYAIAGLMLLRFKFSKADLHAIHEQLGRAQEAPSEAGG